MNPLAYSAAGVSGVGVASVFAAQVAHTPSVIAPWQLVHTFVS
jgi:hypothetical protein